MNINKRVTRNTRGAKGSTLRADLHVHSTFSDGAFTPSELMEMAAELKLTALSITDHDAIGGLGEGLRKGREVGIELVPGVEISAGVGSHEVHILGYYFDPDHDELNDKLLHFQSLRLERIRRMLEQLAGLGILIDYDYVLTVAGEGAVGRPHVAKALVEYGYVGTMSEAFDKLIGDDKPGYVSRNRTSPQEAIALIHRAGGVACWAHPGLENHDEWLDGFVALGLDGLEIIHPEHSPGDEARYRAMAAHRGLLITGGSDFHGGNGAGGSLLGQFATDPADVTRLREASEIRRNTA